MKIIESMTPIRAGEEEVRRRQERYDQLTEGLGVRVKLHDLPPKEGTPPSFDTPEYIAASDPFVVEAAAEMAAAGAQRLMPDCILDPGLVEIGEREAADSYGILRLTIGLFEGLGIRYGAVARNDAIADALDKQIRIYDPSDRYLGCTVLGLTVEDVAQPALWNKAVVGCAEDFAQRGARAVINGCSAVAVEAETAIPVVDPTKLALHLLDLSREFGLLG